MHDLWEDIDRMKAPEGNVEKYIFKKADAVAEAVLYKYPSYSARTVICCSTQSGCPVGCRFCGAGDYFVRNLKSDEIVSQPRYLLDLIEAEEGVEAAAIGRLQIMFMSMGEPLLNMRNLSLALQELYQKYPTAALLVSTSGPRVNYDEIIELARRIPTIGLQFSIHESTETARNALVPFKAKLTLPEIGEKGRAFYFATQRRPFFNYCVHERNNSQGDVDRLASLFSPSIWNATISVICERDETLSAAHERQEELTTEFMGKLLERGYDCRRFDPAGQDSIAGGCGQLWQTQKWMKEHPELARQTAGHGLPVLHADGRSLLPVVTG